MISPVARAVWLLMVLGRYGNGDHVTDPCAFRLRLDCLLYGRPKHPSDALM